MLRTLILIIFLSSCSNKSMEEKNITIKSDLENGIELSKLAACAFCHANNFSGGKKLNALSNEIISPNITPHREALGALSDYQIKKGIKMGSQHSASKTKMHDGYLWMNDYDLNSLVGVLRNLKPIKGNYREKEELEEKQVSLSKVPGFIPKLSFLNKVEKGKYIVENVSQCTYCHSTPSGYFSSSKYLEGGSYSYNNISKEAPSLVKNSSFSKWSNKEISRFLKTGIKSNGSLVDSNYCPVEYYSKANQESLIAITEYLQSLH